MKWYKVPGFQIEITKNGKYVRHSINKKVKNVSITKDGYSFISCRTDDDFRTTKRIHQLVALTFIGPVPKGKEVNHKDLNKSNNHYKNLEYKTHSGNIQHAVNHGVRMGFAHSPRFGKSNSMYRIDRSGEKSSSAKLTWDKVKLIRRLWKSKKYSKHKLAYKFKVTYMNIHCIINNKTWKKK